MDLAVRDSSRAPANRLTYCYRQSFSILIMKVLVQDRAFGRVVTVFMDAMLHPESPPCPNRLRFSG